MLASKKAVNLIRKAIQILSSLVTKKSKQMYTISSLIPKNKGEPIWTYSWQRKLNAKQKPHNLKSEFITEKHTWFAGKAKCSYLHLWSFRMRKYFKISTAMLRVKVYGRRFKANLRVSLKRLRIKERTPLRIYKLSTMRHFLAALASTQAFKSFCS